MKWGRRVESLGLGDLPAVWREGYQVFCAHIPSKATRTQLAIALAAKLNVPKETVEYYLGKHQARVEVGRGSLVVGRYALKHKASEDDAPLERDSFALHRSAVSVLEGVCGCVCGGGEPVLLVGETGAGKTALCQFLARHTNHRLHVLNMSQQSESSDILGGYKPVGLSWLLGRIKDEYVDLFRSTFPPAKNKKFLSHVQRCFAKEDLEGLVSLMWETGKAAEDKCEAESTLRGRWEHLLLRLAKIRRVLNSAAHVTPFAFVQGVVVKAAEEGDWVLLDEINLASPETLSILAPLLDASANPNASLLHLPQRAEPLRVHPDFRIFGCMNPATDVGKAELTPGIRSRFTEMFVEEVESREELIVIAESYLAGLSVPAALLSALVHFYLLVRSKASTLASDSWGHHPYFSLRTFCRSLSYASRNVFGNIQRSLYEGLCLSFLTEVERESRTEVLKMIVVSLFGQNPVQLKPLLANPGPCPPGNYKLIEGYWLKCGSEKIEDDPQYVITSTVKRNLKDLARILTSKSYPVLLEGETSVGKTSLIRHLAKMTGTPCVRINNHEHTDLAEYLGSYASDEQGRLVFQDGPLVKALRTGGWLILDELNLAPTDVLEALNRLLDDNRELFLGERQEAIVAHADFRLFATQNPPGLYGGRKLLSRAFRNRFLHLHFSQLEEAELLQILQHRCLLPPSYAARIIAVFHHLQICRSQTGVFSGKESYITLRDVFRWGERYRRASLSNRDPNNFDWDLFMLQHGYMLLAGRCRKEEDAAVVQASLEKEFKRELDTRALFSLDSPFFPQKLKELIQTSEKAQGLHWTRGLVRMAVLAWAGSECEEPVLLVGETGGGKTTLADLIAEARGGGLEWLGCHAMSEAGDFLGRLRPSGSEAGRFEWVAGPLVRAMRSGAVFAVDEVNLGEDSVLERLNSVLEPERTLQLTEPSGDDGGLIKAHPGFRFIATMNPGGDYGKKELSKALRNRLTEIWCDSGFSDDELIGIVDTNTRQFREHLKSFPLGSNIVGFLRWMKAEYPSVCQAEFTPRDVLAWVHFVSQSVQALGPRLAFVHGAFVVFLDGIGGQSWRLERSLLGDLRRESLCKLCELAQVEPESVTSGEGDLVTGPQWGFQPFCIPTGPEPTSIDSHNFDTPTSRSNTFRVLRALSIRKPILLEGSAGVGKSSLIEAVAAASGHVLTRLNLSEQTDLSDLFGTDVPGPHGFAWNDGPLLRAMKEGHWILLDEMNLASQSVLEGLNACLDHRGSVFIPQLGATFRVHPDGTRFFAAQNPFRQGGNRKGLPKSFLNRFTQITLDSLTASDQLMIIESSLLRTDFTIPRGRLEDMVRFNRGLEMAVCERSEWGVLGSPWEFNLRDLIRWTQLMARFQETDPGKFVELLYTKRMRTSEDREKMRAWFAECFGRALDVSGGSVWLSETEVGFGACVLGRETGVGLERDREGLRLLGSSAGPLEALGYAALAGWPALVVGGSGSGKGAAVRSLAALLGRPLAVLRLNSETDALELLGTFHQISWLHNLKTRVLDTVDGAQLGPNWPARKSQLQLASHPSDLLAALHWLSTQPLGILSPYWSLYFYTLGDEGNLKDFP